MTAAVKFWDDVFAKTIERAMLDTTWVWIREPKPGDLVRCRERLFQSLRSVLEQASARGDAERKLGRDGLKRLMREGRTLDKAAIALGVGNRDRVASTFGMLIDAAAGASVRPVTTERA